jgi:hypothetical protein
MSLVNNLTTGLGETIVSCAFGIADFREGIVFTSG